MFAAAATRGRVDKRSSHRVFTPESSNLIAPTNIYEQRCRSHESE